MIDVGVMGTVYMSILDGSSARKRFPSRIRSRAERLLSTVTLLMPTSISWLSTIGLRTPLATAFFSERRMKSCWRLIRPRSPVPSVRHLFADLVLVVPRACVRERLVAVEVHASRDRDVEARVLVARGVLEVHRHTADRVDETLEAGEVDLDEVLDRDAEVLLQRRDEHVGTTRERGVDPLLAARARDRHPQVAWERQDRRPF